MTSYKSRKPPANQKSISSFFFPASATKSTSATSSAPIQSSSPVKPNTRTPEKLINAIRSSSTLVQKSQGRSSFDEPPSSDTSFVSPEIDNFRNPLLKHFTAKSVVSPTKSKSARHQELFVVSDTEDEKENKRPATQEPTSSSLVSKPGLKRAATSNLLDFLSEKPKKPRKKPASTRNSPPPSSGSRLVTLSDEQLAIVDAVVKRGDNVFFTGSAGTGKSVVLRSVVAELYRKYGQNFVGVTASTGLAACNIKGQTIHKYLGIGLGTGSPMDLANRIRKNPLTRKKWSSLKVLLIDEISMIDGRLFTKIDEIAKVLRNSKAPFGGIQIVCCGDFFQLPPVDPEGKGQYCFHSPSWKSAMKHTIVLRKVFRQEGDNELIDMLNALREGVFSEESLRLFHSLKRQVHYEDGIEPTELFPTRNEVKRANDSRLMKLQSDSFTFNAIDNDKSPQSKRLFENLMCEEKVTLKVGAQVMYLKNHPDSTIVNGSLGKVVGFLPDGIFAAFFMQFHPEDFINARKPFLQMVEVLCNSVGKDILPEEYRGIFQSFPEVWRQKLAPLISEASRIPKGVGMFPVVNFKTNDVTTMILVQREEFSVDQGRNFMSSASAPQSLVREQLPLILAWAMSIHKSQGQSIDRLRVDLRRTFEKGQVYVALSRATNKEQLEVFNFDHRRITVSEEVREFYKSLKSAGE
ncbi:hypothetical protein JCM33374_g4260 [Metschnikowia sp. JCM 33374]|nr:hypothetical protein JCM33374_g4260 [Metschnikowia sp. JCM 33374]